MSSEDDKVRIRVAEIMSSAGVGYNQIALEVLYMLPREFIDRYIELFGEAYGPTVKAPGDGMARDGELGKAPTSTKDKGKKIGAGAGGGGKRMARVFGMRSEPAFRLKERVDKRLRSISRDVREELSLIADRTITANDHNGDMDNAGGDKGRSWMQCRRCGRMMTLGWKYCPHDASILIDPELILEAHRLNDSHDDNLDHQAKPQAARK